MVKRSFAIEDGNLNKVSITSSSAIAYSDIDLSFEHKTSGDIFKKVDGEAVKQSVKNILMTNHGEKPFRPKFGGNLNDFLFELNNDDISQDIEQNIRLAIENYEPRAVIQDIDLNINPDANFVNVSITFNVISSNETIVLNTNLNRIR